MYTDPKRIKVTDPGTVEGNPVFIYLDAFATDRAEVDEFKARYRAGKIGDVELKGRLAEILNQFLDPIRERRRQAEKMDLNEIVKAGTNQAEEIAREVLVGMEEAMHLGYPR
jgi:tryptophanyl-tRNA synthetase